MADAKISELPIATSSDMDGTELVPIVKSGITWQTTTQDIAGLTPTGGGGGSSTVSMATLGLPLFL